MRREKILGDHGEHVARRFLEKKGFKFLEQNYHAQGGEIDLIFYDSKKKEYVVIEVKTRCSDVFGFGEASVTLQKFNKILSAVEDFFLKKLKKPMVPFFRIDAVIIEIDGDKVFCEHIEDIGFNDFDIPCNEEYFG